MKFALPCSTFLALAASSAAFAPAKSFARQSSNLGMSAVETPTYTFTKSEEIFAEAQEVRSTLKKGP